MAKRPSEFIGDYHPLAVVTESGSRFVSVNRYCSGSPWNKPWPKKAIADIYHFVHRTAQYNNKNFDRDHKLYGNGFAGQFKMLPQFVPLSWTELQSCYYGKGLPNQFRNALRIIDYYLNYADMSLSYLGWKARMSLTDYAYWYLGIDCNGFGGAYYQTVFPETGISGHDHINNLASKKTLTERTSFGAMRMGDLLVRRGEGGDRHVTVIDSIISISGKEARVGFAHSSSSYGGLSTDLLTLRDIAADKTTTGYGTLKWHLVGYYKFHQVLGPK